MLSFVKQSVLATDFGHFCGHVKVVCQKDKGEFLHKSFFDITFFHGSLKAINPIYSVHIKAVNLIYLYIRDQVGYIFYQFLILYFAAMLNSL